jgi:hypothetical protein
MGKTLLWVDATQSSKNRKGSRNNPNNYHFCVSSRMTYYTTGFKNSPRLLNTKNHSRSHSSPNLGPSTTNPYNGCLSTLLVSVYGNPCLLSECSLNPQAVLLPSCTVARLISLLYCPSKLPPVALCITHVLSHRIKSPLFSHSTLSRYFGCLQCSYSLLNNSFDFSSDSPSM